MLLVTGSAGLVGRGLVRTLREAGIAVREFDTRTNPHHDTCNPRALSEAMRDVSGIVHLAAISRVVWAQRAPALAQQVNVDALSNLLGIAANMKRRPWVVFASSREVYGEQAKFPVRDDAQLAPMNAYAVTKAAGERLMGDARAAGMRTAICRFSNVFGCVDDHADRVIPAFARAAAFGGELRVEGGSNTFDFTFVDDVVDGLHKVIDAVEKGEKLPPLHFVSGRPTSLFDLAAIAFDNARGSIAVHECPSRTYDVSHFYGDPNRTHELLGWRTSTAVETGFAHLVQQLSINESRFIGTALQASNLAQEACGKAPALY